MRKLLKIFKGTNLTNSLAAMSGVKCKKDN